MMANELLSIQSKHQGRWLGPQTIELNGSAVKSITLDWDWDSMMLRLHDGATIWIDRYGVEVERDGRDTQHTPLVERGPIGKSAIVTTPQQAREALGKEIS